MKAALPTACSHKRTEFGHCSFMSSCIRLRHRYGNLQACSQTAKQILEGAGSHWHVNAFAYSGSETVTPPTAWHRPCSTLAAQDVSETLHPYLLWVQIVRTVLIVLQWQSIKKVRKPLAICKAQRCSAYACPRASQWQEYTAK